MEAQEKGGVTIREYLDMQIEFVNKELVHIREKIAHEREMGTAASAALTKALELQAEKYEQRLTALNHEAQRLQLMVTREMFDQVVGTLEKEIEELKQWKSRQGGKTSVSSIISAIGIIIAAVALILSITK